MSILNRRAVGIVAAGTVALMIAAPGTALAADLPAVPDPGTAVPNKMIVAATVAQAAAVTATPLLFGNYNANTATDTNNVAPSKVVVAATPGTAPVIALDGGQSNDINDRKMANVLPGNSLSYQIYQDAAHTKVWGNTPATVVKGSATLPLQTFDAYGVIPKGQYATTGAYVDTVNVSVTF